MVSLIVHAWTRGRDYLDRREGRARMVRSGDQEWTEVTRKDMTMETWDNCCYEGRYVHTHECRDCYASIWCEQSDEECDRNGGISQYGGICDDCHRRESVAKLVARINLP